MSSKKRKSEEDPTTSTAMNSDTTGKKRRRLSDTDSVVDKKSKKSKKEKKSKKSSSSSKKDKERKHVPSAEDEDATAADNAALEANASPEDTPMDEAPPPAVEPQGENGEEGKAETEESSKKSKKDKKDKKDKKAKSKSKSKEKSEPQANNTTQDPTDAEPVDTTTTTTTTANANNDDSDNNKPTPEDPRPPKKVRFIVFVGNLPYTATPAQITAHFSAVHPTSVRLLHDPRTRKSRGIAFVEFARYDHMKSCLKTMHHTTFTCAAPGKAGRPEERRINVELTAGGGGNTDHRKEKIRAKNEKLDEERARRALEEAKAKAKAEKEKGKGKGQQNGGEKAGGGGVEDAIHPSRRGRVPGAGS
ncbi:hypothetical protein F4814DRAFT_413051 [Daldinia grandis]|nr:hypothetical protein F4814DRAFT_413051 [Daldinia grandis]